MNRRVVTIFTLTVVLSITLSMLVFPYAEAKPNPSETKFKPWDSCGILSITFTCFNILEEQNKEIIKKLDWNNCAMKYKSTSSYKSGVPEEVNSIFGGTVEIYPSANNYEDLIKFCGEVP